jgi:uncharacterized protein (DUF433 family)
MSVATTWRHLESRPKSAYRQLFLMGTRVRADVVHGLYVNDEDPMTAEEIAEDYNLPLEAVREAIAYVESNPPEVEADFQREEELMQATGMNDQQYKHRPTPQVIPTAERARILGS